MRPYIAIDLETTALPTDKAEILEFGFVYDDGVSELGSLVKKNFIIKAKSWAYAEPFAMNLNARLVQIIKEGKDPQLATLDEAFRIFAAVLVDASEACMAFDTSKGWKPSPRVYLAGKNAGGFDLPILKNSLTRAGYVDHVVTLDRCLHYKILDPGSMYAADFGYIPSLGEINKLVDPTRSDEAAHEALEDALDVVRAIRFKEKKQ